MNNTLSLLIEDDSQIAGARREALQHLPRTLYDEVERGEISIIITELVTNLLKHVGRGELLINPVEHDVSKGIEIIALDRGPGIPNIAASMGDGFSTAGTYGNGLGAIERLSTTFDIYSHNGNGTAVFSRYVPGMVVVKPQPVPLVVGGVNIALRGEEVCGDDWEYKWVRDEMCVLLADGLGHGVDAHVAAESAVHIFQKATKMEGESLMEDIHHGLRATRGAAVSLAWIDPNHGIAKFLGVGNVSGAVASSTGAKKFANANGTVGHVMRKSITYSYPWDKEQLLVLHSDGIGTQWNLADYPGLTQCMPSLIAAVLYRDNCRGRDDASIVVVKHEVG